MWSYVCYTLFSKCHMRQVSTTSVSDSTDGEHAAFKVDSGSWSLQMSTSSCFQGLLSCVWYCTE